LKHSSKHIMAKSIVTKFGDKGKTLLYGGKAVDKNHIRIEACGDIDELNSYLGFSKSLVNQPKIKKIIGSLQKDLFIVGAEVVSEPRVVKKLDKRIDEVFINNLQKYISGLEKKGLPKRRCFCVPGKNTISASLDVARSVTRRIERRILTLIKKKKLKNKYVLIYFNRLSDLLYLLARYYDSNS